MVGLTVRAVQNATLVFVAGSAIHLAHTRYALRMNAVLSTTACLAAAPETSPESVSLSEQRFRKGFRTWLDPVQNR